MKSRPFRERMGYIVGVAGAVGVRCGNGLTGANGPSWGPEEVVTSDY